MPDLVVEQVSISWLPEQGDGFAVFECRVLAIVGVPARVVTSGDDLSNAVIDGICPAEWEEYVQYEAGNGNVRIVARHVVGKRKVNSIRMGELLRCIGPLHTQDAFEKRVISLNHLYHATVFYLR